MTKHNIRAIDIDPLANVKGYDLCALSCLQRGMSGAFVTHYGAQQDMVDSIFHPSLGAAKRPSSRSNNEGVLRLLTEYMIPGKGVDAWGPNFWEIKETYAHHPCSASTKLWSKAMTSCCSTSDEAARMKQSRQRKRKSLDCDKGR